MNEGAFDQRIWLYKDGERNLVNVSPGFFGFLRLIPD